MSLHHRRILEESLEGAKPLVRAAGNKSADHYASRILDIGLQKHENWGGEFDYPVAFGEMSMLAAILVEELRLAQAQIPTAPEVAS